MKKTIACFLAIFILVAPAFAYPQDEFDDCVSSSKNNTELTDVTDESIRGIIGKEHEYADSLGIFGTPTFVFDDGEVVFLKTFTPAAEDSVAEFEHFLGVSRRSNIGEIKRPQPPWPKGVMD